MTLHEQVVAEEAKLHSHPMYKTALSVAVDTTKHFSGIPAEMVFGLQSVITAAWLKGFDSGKGKEYPL